MSTPPPPPSTSSPTQSALLARFPPLRRLHLLHPSLPLPTLLLSFGVMHEITAIAPVVGLFYGFRSFGGGRSVVDGMIALETTLRGDKPELGQGTVEGWLEEGERRVERVGRRYGILGFPKVFKGNASSQTEGTSSAVSSLPRNVSTISGKDLAGDVANAVGAYMVVKASLLMTLLSALHQRSEISHARLSLSRLCFLSGSARPSTSLLRSQGSFSFPSVESGRRTFDVAHERRRWRGLFATPSIEL